MSKTKTVVANGKTYTSSVVAGVPQFAVDSEKEIMGLLSALFPKLQITLDDDGDYMGVAEDGRQAFVGYEAGGDGVEIFYCCYLAIYSPELDRFVLNELDPSDIPSYVIAVGN